MHVSQRILYSRFISLGKVGSRTAEWYKIKHENIQWRDTVSDGVETFTDVYSSRRGSSTNCG